MRQEAKEYPSFPLGNRFYIWLGLYIIREGKLFIRRVRKRKITQLLCFVKQDKLFFVYDLLYYTQTKHFLDFLK